MAPRKKKEKTETEIEEETNEDLDPPKKRPVDRTSLLMLFVLLVTFAGIWIIGRLINLRAESLSGNTVLRQDILCTPQPDWIIEPILEKVFVSHGITDDEPINLADEDLVSSLGTSLESSIWIRSARITKRHQSLSIEIDFRQPVLCVFAGNGCCYVDETGMALPPDEATDESKRNCLVAEGLSEVPVPVIGETFVDDRVQRASRLAKFLLPHKEDLELLVIQVLSKPKSPFTCDFRTRQGTVVYWSRGGNEPTEDAKLKMLLDYRQRFGNLSQPSGPYKFDVTNSDFSGPVALDR